MSNPLILESARARILPAFYAGGTVDLGRRRLILRGEPRRVYGPWPISPCPTIFDAWGDGHARDATQSPRADREAAAAAPDDPVRGELEPGLASARAWSERLVMWSHGEHGGKQHRLVLRSTIAWHLDTL